MSHSNFCICCMQNSDLVSVHEELSLQGYISKHSNAAALVDHCFNIKIVTCEVLYAMCSTCVSKLVQSCILRDQLIHNLNFTTDNKDIINVKREYNMDDGILVEPLQLSDSEMKEEYTESIHHYEDVYNSDTISDDPSFVVNEKSVKQKTNKKAAENNLNKVRKKIIRSNNGTFIKKEQLLNEKNVGVKVNVEIKNYFTEFNLTELPLEISKRSDFNKLSITESIQKDIVKVKSESKILRDEFESLLLNCKNFALFSWFKSKYRCLLCSEIFSNKTDFSTHALKHSTEDFEKFFPNGECCLKVDISSMKCRHCDESVREMDAFRSHLFVSHNIQADDLLRRILPFHLTEPKVKCGVCNKDFVSMSTLNEHMNEHSTNYICPHCGKLFVSHNRLRGHMNKLHVTGIFKCTKCDETFESIRKRQCHVAKVHNRRQYLCQNCPETFRSSGDKLRHLAEVHNEELRRYKCETCPAAYMTAKDLHRHIRNVHLQERKHRCSVCGYSFFDIGTLRDHRVIHTGEKAFECQICHKKFARRGNLNQHKRVHKK